MRLDFDLPSFAFLSTDFLDHISESLNLTFSELMKMNGENCKVRDSMQNFLSYLKFKMQIILM